MFRKRINQLFQERHCSIVDFADEIGITRQSLTYYLNGDRKPDYPTLLKICQSLNVSADWLFGLSDIRTPSADIQTACKTLHITENTANTIIHLQEHDPEKPVDLLFEQGNDMDFAFCMLSSYSLIKKLPFVPTNPLSDPVLEKDGSVKLESDEAAAYYIHQFTARIERLLINDLDEFVRNYYSEGGKD